MNDGRVPSASLIGKRAEVEVSSGKFVTLHELRRSFGLRWAQRLLLQQLMQIMRHESIDTTLRYYVAHDAEGIAEEMWRENGGNGL